jgi:hypothetical protein
MNRELMTEDLAIYLPYNLMVETKGNERTELIGLKGDTAFLKDFTYPCDVSDIQPLLRPVSTIKENAHLFSHGILPSVLQDIVDGKSGFYLSEMPYSVVIALVENHFDINQLIDEGLAISLNN